MSLVTVVVPIHNEAEHLESLLPMMIGELEESLQSPQELILVENGSTDATLALAEHACEQLRSTGWKASVLTLPTPDYGGAMRYGFTTATGDWVVNFDIDYFSGGFVAGLAGQRADIVIASKRAPGSRDERSFVRRTGTYAFNQLLRLALGSKVSDTHGIKAFRRDVMEAHLPEVLSGRDLFDTELVLRAERAGRDIVEVPIVVEERRAARTSLARRVPGTLAGVLQLRRAFARERRAASL
ncbi:MAG: glycosyltransferase family 2 protein [Acidimicrobiia bacterium]|nr:glycosyltransferase family 2 protein [Acidimicrobiia bacterium]